MGNPLAPTTSDSRRTPFLTDRDNSGTPGFQKGVNAETLGSHTTPSLTALVAGQSVVSDGAYADHHEPDVFTPFDLSAVTTEQAVWTPTSGKKVRLLAIHIKATAETTVAILDDSGGPTLFTVGCPAGVPVTIPLGKVGILSALADNVLYVTSTSSADLSGTFSGNEE